MGYHEKAGNRGWGETLPVKVHHDVYPCISPTPAWEAQSFKGKAIFITGASRGIGRSTAITFAKAGAAVAIAARSSAALDETLSLMLKEAPEAKVKKYAVDVTNSAEMEMAVDHAAATFGGLDVVIANAGYTNAFDNTLMDQRATPEWWRTFEINVLGVYNTIKPALKFLRKVEGYFIAVTSTGAQLRTPGASDYDTSKHAVNRLVEFIAAENPSIKAFPVHPGAVATELAKATKLEEKGIEFNDPPELAASTMLYLCSGNLDWMNGRYVDVNWDWGQVERVWKDKILENDLLINKLDVRV
ncbi:unnamed protein product [Peniophora sp. CBMAI 1063]|nr:unnamed protein product [Peniophora sp. CBMAI 1063]